MKIDNLFSYKEKNYLYLERYVNDGSPSGFDRIHTSSKQTSPRDGADYYSLPIIEFNNNIKFEYIGDDKFLSNPRQMFCHPDNLNHPLFTDNKQYWEIVGKVNVSPTASARTVKIQGKDYFVKLDYINYLGRITRNLDYQHIISAFEVSKDIRQGIDTKVYNKKFAFLPENKGRIAYIPKKDGTFYEFGYILREAIPYSNLSNKDYFLIPAFSLFGHDYYNQNDESIIIQLFHASNISNINDFAYNNVFEPIIQCYFDPLINHGLALEAHAQNTLIAIDNNFKIQLIVSRDMESVDKDISLREKMNISTNYKSINYKCIRNNDYNYTIKHSFMFDFKLGEYLLTPLINTFSSDKNFNKELIFSKIKHCSLEYIKKLPNDYFPNTWYDYANKQFAPNEKRPYRSNGSPKYR